MGVVLLHLLFFRRRFLYHMNDCVLKRGFFEMGYFGGGQSPPYDNLF